LENVKKTKGSLYPVTFSKIVPCISNVEMLQGPRPPPPRGNHLPQMVGKYPAKGEFDRK